ncbi:MAG: efflux transporter outer membrane subunit [Rhodanobacter sp.]
MRLHLLAVGTALTLALAGCASSGGLHPDGSPIDAGALKARQSLAGTPVSPAAWPSADWWTGLNDPQLDQLMSEALKDNPSLAIADARAREAQAQVGFADAARLPTLNASGSVSGARLPPNILPGGGGSENGGDGGAGGSQQAARSHFMLAKYADLDFKWSLDLWGGKRAAWEAALGTARASDVAARAARVELSGNVARAYAQLGYAFTQHDLARAELVRAIDARQLTRQRVTAGIDNKIQLRQGDAEVASAQQQGALARRAIDSARSSLSVLLGKGPDRGLEIQRPHTLTPAQLAIPSSLPVELIGHRADLVAARWRVEAASKDIKSAKTEFLPNVSIGALAGFIAVGSGSPFSLPQRFYEFGPTLSLPIFDGGRLRANLNGKDAQYDLAVAQYNQTLVRALNQVSDGVSAMRSLDEQLAAQQRAEAAARDAYELSQQRYKAGIGSYLESLSVRQQLLGAERGTAQLKAQKVDLSVQIIEALGGGFQPRGDAPVLSSDATSPNPSRS